MWCDPERVLCHEIIIDKFANDLDVWGRGREEGKIKVTEDFKGFGLNTWKGGIIIDWEGKDLSGENFMAGRSEVSLQNFEFEMLLPFLSLWVFPTQGSNLSLVFLLHMHMGSLPLVSSEKPHTFWWLELKPKLLSLPKNKIVIYLGMKKTKAEW